MKSSIIATVAADSLGHLVAQLEALSTGPVGAEAVKEIDGAAESACRLLMKLGDSLTDGGPKMLSQDGGYMSLLDICKFVAARILIGVGAEHLKRDAADVRRAVGFLESEERAADAEVPCPV